jgi:hypothetical protein
MLNKTRSLVLLTAAAALLALPATGGAAGKGEAKRCEKAPKFGYTVRGTLVDLTADTVTITVTGANRHARNSGEIADQDLTKDGVQVAGATYTVDGTSDPFNLRLNEFEDPDTPSAGDAVKVNGRIARTRSKCAPDGTSLADRYGAPDVRKVTVTDSDPDV